MPAVMRVLWALFGVAALAAFAGVGWHYNESRRQHAERIQRVAEEDARHIASTQERIDRITARDPLSDAAQDRDRGDQTPIGISYTPHEGPMETRFPGLDSCEVGSHGYEPTGKPFTETEFGFGHFAPPNWHQLERAANAYATRYNRRMQELAPEAIARFCRTWNASGEVET